MTTSASDNNHARPSPSNSPTHPTPWNDFIQTLQEEVISQNQEESEEDYTEEILYRIDGYEMM